MRSAVTFLAISACWLGVAQGNTTSFFDHMEDEGNFRGVVQTLPASGLIGTWQISGRNVVVSAATAILPTGNAPAVGDCVMVQATLLANGNLQATRIVAQGRGACQMAPGQEERPKLIGLVQVLPAGGLIGNWTVAGTTVAVSATTRIDTENGPVAVNACVQVRGTMSGAVLNAGWVETEQASECQTNGFEFSGVIQAKPASGNIGTWTISGKSVTVTAATILDTSKGNPIVGACVEVEGTMDAGGIITATRFKVESTSGSCIFRNGVMNAGSFASFAVSPGQIVSIFGMNIGPATQLPMAFDPDGRVSHRLGNTTVTFDGTTAPMLFASEGQINVITPCAIAGKTSTAVQVNTNGAVSNTRTIPVVPAAPSLFTLSESGAGRAAALNYDEATKTYSVNDPSNPSSAGRIIVVFGTGFGLTDKGCVDGAVNSGTMGKPLLDVLASIGGKPATVLFVGDAPQLVNGVFQVNLLVPAGVTAAPNVDISLTVGGRATQGGVTVAVK